jgi:apolipoprotein D and lipocalin family protein
VQAMKKALLVVSLATVFVLVTRRSCAARSSTVQTVADVDLARYAGVWHEIARYPNRFQEGCLGTTATYTVHGEKLEVTNSCRNEDGSTRQVKGSAWAVDQSNARLKVSFFWPFRGDYWIMDLGPYYEYAVVGTPDRKLLWVLSRSAQIDDAVYAGILERIKAQGFDPGRLIKTLR